MLIVQESVLNYWHSDGLAADRDLMLRRKSDMSYVSHLFRIVQ